MRVEDRLVNMVAEGPDAGIRLVESIDRDMVHIRLTPAAGIVVVRSLAVAGVGLYCGLEPSIAAAFCTGAQAAT